MQKESSIFPIFLDVDKAYDKIGPNESPFAKGLTFDINANPGAVIGSNNPSGEGQNMYVLTPLRSNMQVPATILPEGFNKCIGTYQSDETQELYYFNKNANNQDGIYVISGNTGVWSAVVVDPALGFSFSQKHFIAHIRVSLRVIRSKAGDVIEKILLLTDGNGWQKWILVNTGIATSGYSAALYPYFTPLPPHFDRREVLEWAVRPCMINPVVEAIANTVDDAGKPNTFADTATQVAVAYNYTDGRPTTLSPYSLPLIINSTDFLNNPDNLPKKAKATIYAGGVWVESVDIYMRQSEKSSAGKSSQITWQGWRFYKRIYKYSSDPKVLETEFWLRTNAFQDFNFNSTFNTFEYTIDGSELGLPPIIDVARFQNDLPQVSVAHASLAETELLVDNRYGYDNLSGAQLEVLDVEVKEKPDVLCKTELAEVTLYGYVGMADTDFAYKSQVGYINGDDLAVRFGGLREATLVTNRARIDFNESKFFDLQLAGKNCFRIYAKGTPYFADGEWVIVNTDNSITEIGSIYDFSSNDVLQAVQNIYESGAYFAIRWKLKLPKGRYDVAVGRHSVVSSGDYRNTSSYVYGIANSRIKSTKNELSQNGPYQLVTVKPNAIVDFSKEFEVDCTAGDVDPWGNGKDMFYIYCPYNHSTAGAGNFRFIEGYFQEDNDSPLPVELFPYTMSLNNADDWGKFTDKNGFYWSYTKANDSSSTNIIFSAKVNCIFPTDFTIPTSQVGIGWMQNKVAYLSDNNNGVVGDCNRVIVTGRITSLDGLIGYSNIAISIKDGSTAITGSDGFFQLIVHNGQGTMRVSNMYVNAGGNFSITIAGCGQIPLFPFNETLAPCIQCQPRPYPIPLNLAVNAEGGAQLSLKESAMYPVGIAIADLAGRAGFVNPIKSLTVPSFIQRGDILATYFQAAISGQLKLEADIAWAAFYVGPRLNMSYYVDWVGDKIQYVDSNGNVVADPASAVFCAIYIDSLYNTNVANNFTLLSNYQFNPLDRIRFIDDGDGSLLASEINVQILGTNYNQAAINAGILPNTDNPVVNVNTTELQQSIVLYVRYDQRLDQLLKKTGFWIEIYTPSQQTDKVPYSELKWYPVINGEIAIYKGFSGGAPLYEYPASIILDYWDTYLFNRTIDIPDVGAKFFNRPFNSPNVTDSWGYNLSSGGRQLAANPNARQLWYTGDTIESNNLNEGGSINGLGMFRGETRKDYSYAQFGPINFVIVSRGIVFFGCEADYFTVDFQQPYAKVDAQGNIRANADSGLSLPRPKVGDRFGFSVEDMACVFTVDKYIVWFDRKNTAIVKSDYATAVDITKQDEQAGERGGLQSYVNQKTFFITRWNNTRDENEKFDVIGGVDEERGNLYFSFRPRRKNTTALNSFINQRRNFDTRHQETLVYSMKFRGWIPCAPFAPEAYGRLRGNDASKEFYSFAAGMPYIHNNTPNHSFGVFYGVQTEPCFIGVFNKDGNAVKVIGAIRQNINGSKLFVDMIYGTQDNSFSYLPENYFKEKEKNAYSEVLRDMSSYLAPVEKNKDLSTLIDGKRLFGPYFICRFVQKFEDLGNYFQLTSIDYMNTDSVPEKV